MNEQWARRGMTASAEDEPQDDIERIEAQLEQLAGVLERCRKVGLFAKTVLAAGGLILVAVVVGATPATPLAVLGSMAALVGGTVLYGSNYGTLQHTTAAIAKAELARTELIDSRELRLVWSEDSPAADAREIGRLITFL